MNHLDLGCGLTPKNPYGADRVFGCDIRDISSELSLQGVVFKKANLAIERIPYADNFFDSLSALDFLEHIPRQMMNADGKLVNPLVNLINEVYRVLKPNGVFFASTPIFPHPSAFVDPTHVNIMTDKTYLYFIGNKALGQMYGFNGNFEAIKVLRETPSNFINPQETNLRKILRRFHRKYFRGGLSHHVWELKAVK